MPTIDTNDGARLLVDRRGTGRPSIVFLGGWCMGHWWWQKQTDALAARFTCIAYDARAYGGSAKVSYGHRVYRHAMDLREVISQSDLTEVVVVGWSTGASTILAYIDLFTAAGLRGVVLVDQSPRNLNTDDWKLGFGDGTVADEFLRSFAADQRTAASNLVREMLLEPPTTDLLEEMVHQILQTPLDSALRLQRDDFHQDWRDLLPHVDVPILVVAGKQSRLFPTAANAYIAEHVPDGELVLFARSGHCPFWEEPKRFNEVVAHFALSCAASHK